MVAVVLTFALGGLANDCANARACRSANNRALQATAKDCSQHSTASAADQRALTWANPALVAAMVVMVWPVTAVVIVPTASAVAHAVVVSAIVPVLRERRNNGSGEEKRSKEHRFSKMGHLPLDAELETRGDKFSRKFPLPALGHRQNSQKKRLKQRPPATTIATTKNEGR
jgi:hypothetical protein